MKAKKPVKISNKFDKKPTRKQLRKEQRKQKKQRKQDYYTKRKKPGLYVLTREESGSVQDKKQVLSEEVENLKHLDTQTTEQLRKKEMKEKSKLEKRMAKQRKKQLLEANLEEDRVIRHLEKQLNLHKRKSKGIPKSFCNDGLDYLLEVCDPELKKSVLMAEEATDRNEEFEQDFELMTRKTNQNEKSKIDSENDEFALDNSDDSNEASDMSTEENEDDFSDEGEEDEVSVQSDDSVLDSDDATVGNSSDNKSTEDENSEAQLSDTAEKGTKRKQFRKSEDINCTKRKKVENQDVITNTDDSDKDSDSSDKEELENEDEGIWEDIYGRKRRKDGSVVVESKQQKYIPPAARATNDTSVTQKTEKLRKLLKGLLNRLAESNMHNIASQIENLYMNNSRNDMNETITNLVLESVISHVNTPERLLMEHILLIVILHANVGTEVGAHFLQTIAKKFDMLMKEKHPIENKMLDNVTNVLSQLYNFKLFDSKLIYEILDVLSKEFAEKEVECILHILRSVGFTLRKDNPLALKELILKLQKQASNVSEETKDNSRVKFMLDILLAIKNNNVTKIPNYDPSYSEHLKKLMKGFVRKGNYVSQLNISLEDLLKVDERGRWWVVGSAWTGTETEKKATTNKDSSNSFSQKLLDLARKQRMNTDTRRTIFCIIMSAEDYLEAFEKLLKLGLKNQQEQEIINVILHCLLHEKAYNPYYSVLAQKFCECDRKYQMIIKYSVWDKLKVLSNHSAIQLSNLAKLLIHLFMEKALPISTLKIIQFSELDKVTVRFMRQILLGILLHEDLDTIREVFEKVALSEKLKMFRESIYLFISHFLLNNLKQGSINDEQKNLLQTRAKVISKLLLVKSSKSYF